jgi:pyruvyltransferase
LARVELVHWNPRRRLIQGSLGRYIRVSRPLNNFGDLLGPYIVKELLRRRGLKLRTAASNARLLSVGSVMQHARDGDVVWGTGVNGKSVTVPFQPKSLDVRAVRGPLTQAFLAERGIVAPSIFGDPALLLGRLFDRAAFARADLSREVLEIPNLNDFRRGNRGTEALSPQSPLSTCLAAIASSHFVTGSSLHAIIVADAFGIPARLIKSETEPDFKYRDYYLGSGRDEYSAAGSVAEAVSMGGEPPIDWDHRPLLNAFPEDLWLKERLNR